LAKSRRDSKVSKRNQEWLPPRKKYKQNYNNEICKAPPEDSKSLCPLELEELLQSETAAEKMARLTVSGTIIHIVIIS
jgi:hypothetical protein